MEKKLIFQVVTDPQIQRVEFPPREALHEDDVLRPEDDTRIILFGYNS